jgi:hypothetical protein
MKPDILVFGKHPEILAVVLRLIQGSGEYSARGTTDEKELLIMAGNQPPDLLLLGGGVSKEEEEFLRSRFFTSFPQTRIFQHFGGGSGLLFAEIKEALAN